tara:strand:- start:5038 stop:5577 length:540 start_codon:yes stop_codon:yes gene_type:complete
MSMDSQQQWLGFTIVCFVLLLGILVHEGKIDLNQEKTSSENTDEVSSTADNIHPFGEYCLTEHNSSMGMHIHPYLTIIIDGEEFEIEESAGIYTDICPNAMHMVHTHDTTGKLHVENYTAEDVPLEVFFDVWGKHFNETGIFDFRDGSIEMTVDGEINYDYENLILADNQNIVITYTSN